MVELEGVAKRFSRRAFVQSRSFALHDISLTVERGEVVGILGESGSGKSTVANIITRLTAYDSGSYRFEGRDMKRLSRAESFEFKSKVQIVFQDPYGSLNPRATVQDSLLEALVLHQRGLSRQQRLAEAARLFEEVGLGSQSSARYPHAFSGGQRQRIAIARALAVQPELLVCDEPLSSLDVSIQAQILELFVRLIRDRHLTIIFISHDVSVMRLLCDRVYVMNQGRIVESGRTSDVLEHPKDDYTARLLEAVY